MAQTCISLFDAAAPDRHESTAIIFGTTRGGTSMVAGAVRGFGYFMGEALLVNLEDPNFVYRTDEHMRETIAARNRTHPLWGWKYPRAAEYLDRLLPAVRNPFFVIVARDVAATALAMTRWDERDLSGAMAEAALQGHSNLLLAIRHRLPTLYVSYEKAVMDTDLFLTELGQFLGRPLTVDRASLLRFMAPGFYKSFEEVVLRPGEGVGGWRSTSPHPW